MAVKSPKAGEQPDILQNPAFREAGVWEMLRGALFAPPRPFTCVQVEVTSACPGRCVYCPHTTQAAHWQTRHMQDETLAALWPLFRKAGRAHLQGWGEPLLHPRFMDYARFALRAGCRVSTTTCGLRMDEALARELVDSGIDVIAFSLVGTDEASNAARAGVPFERTLEAVRLLQTVRRARGAAHLEIHFAYLMLASRMEAVLQLPELMQELGVHAAVISTLDYIAAPGLEAEAFAAAAASSAAVPEKTEQEKTAAARRILRELGAKAKRLDVSIYSALPGAKPVPGGCREEAARTLYVDADGNLSPCVYANPPLRGEDPGRRVFGNVRQGDPLAAWQSEAWTAFRAALDSPQPDTLCRCCPKRFEVPEEAF